MVIQSTLKYGRISPRKVRFIADRVKKMRIDEALTALTFSNKKGAIFIKKALETTLADAKNNFKMLQDNLMIKSIEVNEGPFFKRWRAVSKGSAHGYKKRVSHIKVVLEPIKIVEPKKVEEVIEKKSIKIKEKKNGS